MIIGITGLANSGKDITAKIIKNYLEKDHHYFKILPLAKKLKEVVSILTSIPVEKFENRDFKERPTKIKSFWYFVNDNNKKLPYVKYKGSPLIEGWKLIKPTNREVLVEVGTTIFRSYNPDIWVNLLLESYRPLLDDIIIPDIRFDNEAKEIKKHSKTIIIKIVRPNIEKLNQISEQGIKEEYVDYTILNDGNIQDLKEKIIEILKKENLC